MDGGILSGKQCLSSLCEYIKAAMVLQYQRGNAKEEVFVEMVFASHVSSICHTWKKFRF